MSSKIAIVGGGLAAELLIHQLYQDPCLKSVELTQFYDEDFAPACSLQSTALLTLKAIQKQVSPLGDLLVDAYGCAQDFIQKFSPEGVIPLNHYETLASNSPDFPHFSQRYGGLEKKVSLPGVFPSTFEFYQESAYLFTPTTFMDWLQKQNQQHARVKKFIRDQEELKDFDLQVFCTGAYSKVYSHLNLAAEETKTVSGSYLVFKNTFLGEESFSLSWKNTHGIYHSHEKRLTIGNTTDPKGVVLGEWAVLKECYQQLQDIWKGVCWPNFSEAELHTGLRHKGKKRLPFWGELAQNSYGFWGLYKNGYSLGFLGAQQLARVIRSRL